MGVFTPERRRQAPPSPPPQYEPPRAPRRAIPWGLIGLGIVLVRHLRRRQLGARGLPGLRQPVQAADDRPERPGGAEVAPGSARVSRGDGNFQQVVDLDQDTALPDAILGSRTLYIAYGSVDATVDFSNVDDDSVDVSDDRLTATITLPPPRSHQARIDPTRSYVYDQDEGALNKIGDIFSSNDHDQQQLNVLAVQEDQRSGAAGLRPDRAGAENTRRADALEPAARARLHDGQRRSSSADLASKRRTNRPAACFSSSGRSSPFDA